MAQTRGAQPWLNSSVGSSGTASLAVAHFLLSVYCVLPSPSLACPSSLESISTIKCIQHQQPLLSQGGTEQDLLLTRKLIVQSEHFFRHFAGYGASSRAETDRWPDKFKPSGLSAQTVAHRVYRHEVRKGVEEAALLLSFAAELPSSRALLASVTDQRDRHSNFQGFSHSLASHIRKLHAYDVISFPRALTGAVLYV